MTVEEKSTFKDQIDFKVGIKVLDLRLRRSLVETCCEEDRGEVDVQLIEMLFSDLRGSG